LELHNDYFVSDAIVLRSPEFSTATLVHKTKGKLVTVDCSSWDAVGFWTKPGAPFLCIEPWWGWADSLQNFGDFATKEALHWLEPNEEESLFYEVIIPPNRFI
jgi:galactose mutarotase-like enzyme